MKIYISTNCCNESIRAGDVLTALGNNGLINIELGTNFVSDQSAVRRIISNKEKYGMDLIAHHYFIKRANPIIVNIASRNVAIRTESVEYLKKAIDYCSDLGIECYSFHAGFIVDPDLNFVFKTNDGNAVNNNRTEAFNIFADSVNSLNEFAEKKCVRLAIENNVVARKNMIGNDNSCLLFCSYVDYLKLFDSIKSENIGVNLDLGHLKVSANNLGFDKFDFIDKLNNRIFICHVHDNNGKEDEHGPIDGNSWFMNLIGKGEIRSDKMVLESKNLSIENIIGQKRMLENVLRVL